MILEKTTDPKIVKAVMTDPEMWAKINTDDYPIELFDPIIKKNVTMVMAVVDDVLIGIHMFTEHPDKVLYHPMLLKAFRKDHGRAFFDKGLAWFFNNTEYSRLYAEIPVSHRSTLNLARNLGFEPLSMVQSGVSKEKFIQFQLLRLEKWAA